MSLATFFSVLPSACSTVLDIQSPLPELVDATALDAPIGSETPAVDAGGPPNSDAFLSEAATSSDGDMHTSEGASDGPTLPDGTADATDATAEAAHEADATDETDATDGADASQSEGGALDAGLFDGGAADATSDTASGPVETTTDLTPTKDAYVQDGTSADTNFGTDVKLIVKASGTVGVNRNSWLSFDVSGYSKIRVTKLRLFVLSLDFATTNTIPALLFYAPTASDGWPETGITWHNAPAMGSQVGSVDISDSSVGTWVEYDVTVPVSMETDGVSTFVITSTPQTNRAALLSSREGGNPPVLRITGIHR